VISDKWLERFSHSFVEYDSGIDMVAYGTFKGKEYRAQKFFKGYKASDLNNMLEDMKRLLWEIIEQDHSTIEVPFEEILEALKIIDQHGGVDVRYDRLAAHYGDGQKAQAMYKRLSELGYLKRSSELGNVIMSGTLTPEAKSLLDKSN